MAISINGMRQEYAYEDIKILAFGSTVALTGVVEISYGVTREQVNIYAGGNKPVSMGRGKKEFPPVKMTVLQSLFEQLQASLPTGADLTDVAPFLITVSYAADVGATVTDHLIGCRVTKFDKGMKTGDTHKEIEMELLPFDVQHNV